MEQKFQKPRIGITLGDFNGIGPEVIVKTFSDQRILNFCTPIIYGSTHLFNKVKKQLNAEHFNYQQLKPGETPSYKRVNIVNCWEEDLELTPGKPTPESGQAALKSILAAAEDLKNDVIQGVVTAPIDKDNIQSETFKFPGHTEFFTEFFGATESLMLLAGDKLKVATATGHKPLRDVADAISVDLLIRKLTILGETLQKDFGKTKPRIAVLGLNPHAGENSLLGKEEQEIIIPVIKQLKEKGLLIFGPYPADGFFASQLYQNVDATLAMYHDQGLIPFKTLAFESGVNYTAGLPVVRTSPDHGTAYNIAGKNAADESSFRSAVFMAVDILKKRAELAAVKK